MGPLASRPWQLHGQDRRKRASDNLSSGLTEHEADAGDQLTIPASDGLIPLHEFICVERKRLRLDLMPSVRQQNVLDLVDLDPERHLRTSVVHPYFRASAVRMVTHRKEKGPHKERRPSSFTVIVTRKTNELFVPRR